MFTDAALGFCKWDVPALAVLIVMTAALVTHQIRYNRRKKEYEARLEELRTHGIQRAKKEQEQ